MGTRGMRMGSGEGSTMRNFIVCTVHINIVIQSRRLRWTGPVARMEEGRNAFKILTGKPARKGLLGWPRRRRGDNITMDL